MFFQSPRPFGQHSTSYRSVGGSIHSSSSITSIPTSGLESGRVSAPPYDFVPDYGRSRFESPAGVLSDVPSSNPNLYQVEVSRGPGLTGVIQNQLKEGRSSDGELTGAFPVVSKHRIYYKTTSVQNAADSEISGQDLNVSQATVQAPPSNISSIPRRYVSSQPFWVGQKQPSKRQVEQTAQNAGSYREENDREASHQNIRFRSSSTVPFNDYALKGSSVQSQLTPIFANNASPSIQPLQGLRSTSETQVNNLTQFAAPEISSVVSPSMQKEKSVVYQQLERRKNYATLHHVAIPKMGPLQRQTSDSNLLRIDKSAPPANVAMFNVAKEVREELEQDPKFRKKANSLGNEATNVSIVCPSPSPMELPRQSPSIRQMEHFFDGVQQFRTTYRSKESQSMTSAKPFNVEHVRSIFHTNSPKQQPTVTVMKTENTQENSILKKETNMKVDVHGAEKKSFAALPHISTQTFSIAGKTVVNKLRDTVQIGNNGNSMKNNVQLSNNMNEQSMQTKPSVFVVGRPLVTESSDKSVGSCNPKILVMSPEPVIPDDIAVLEKDYQSIASTTPRRLNQPFPVDGTFADSVECVQTASSPPGILLKNEDGRLTSDLTLKPQKRVAFQCDTEKIATSAAVSKTELDKTSAEEIPSSVMQYDEAVDEPLQRLLKLSVDIGGDLETVSNKLSALFTEQRNFIWSAAGQKEPPASELNAKLGPIVKIMEDLSAFKESKRNTPLFNHISAASEGVQALGWLTVKPTPAPFIKDMLEAAMFFVNRVLKEHKDEKVHIEWAKSWTDVLNALQKYVRQVHTTGLVWNSNPGTKSPVPANRVSSTASPPLSGAIPPPPPPPPPPLILPPVSGTSATDKTIGDRAALFAEINTGEEITKRLKKITPDMQTYKNLTVRAQHEALLPGATEKTNTTGTTSASKKQNDKPPKTWLENGKQWNVEYHKNNNNIIVEIGDMKQTVYVYKCQNSVLQVKGKVNSITMDNCTKTSILLDSLLSQIEIINCQNVQIQTLGTMPTISIQKTDGCQVYLSKEAMNAEIITSKSSGMNVLVPIADDGDFVEFPVPEQFKTIYDGNKLQTTVSDLC